MFCLMYPNRTAIKRLMKSLKQQDRRSNSISSVSQMGSQRGSKQHRPSITAISDSLLWLIPRFEKFVPDCWFMGILLLVQRLLQTTLMSIIKQQGIMASWASVIGLAGVTVQRELNPYRRASDNDVAIYAQGLVFFWCFVLLMIDTGSFGDLPISVVGTILVFGALTVFLYALQKAMADVRSGFVSDSTPANKLAYKKGDFIMYNTDGKETVLSPHEFATSYEPASDKLDKTIAEHGFALYNPTGKIWAHQVTADEISRFFPACKFLAQTESPVDIKPGDWLALPHPCGGELYCVEKHVFEHEYTQANLNSNEQLSAGGYVPSQDALLAFWGPEMQKKSAVFQKNTKMPAKVALKDGVLDTIVDGRLEARVAYVTGDFILRGSRGGYYSMVRRRSASQCHMLSTP